MWENTFVVQIFHILQILLLSLVSYFVAIIIEIHGITICNFFVSVRAGEVVIMSNALYIAVCIMPTLIRDYIYIFQRPVCRNCNLDFRSEAVL